MPKCPKCVNGWTEVFEEGVGDIKTACYHCGNTGEISDEQVFEDRLDALVDSLAWEATEREKAMRNENPDGEDWAFCAAESGSGEHEYTLGVQSGYALRALDVFNEIKKKNSWLLRLLLDKLAPVQELP
jgi:hypothetical protein